MEPNVTAVVAMRVRLARQSRSWTLTDMARESSVSRTHVYEIEQGGNPSIEVLARIADATGQPMAWFFDPMPFCPTCGRPLPQSEVEVP